MHAKHLKQDLKQNFWIRFRERFLVCRLMEGITMGNVAKISILIYHVNKTCRIDLGCGKCYIAAVILASYLYTCHFE